MIILYNRIEIILKTAFSQLVLLKFKLEKVVIYRIFNLIDFKQEWVGTSDTLLNLVFLLLWASNKQGYYSQTILW